MRRAVISLLVLTAALAGAAAPATARSQTAQDRSQADEHRRVVNYWTAERRAKAIPRDMTGGRNVKVPMAKPGGSGGTSSGAWTQGGYVAVTTGKVFFTLGGVNYVCSGSAVESGRNSLVLTAGHCVHDGGGGPFATNWMFAPRYNNGYDAALGKWTATQLYVTDDWARSTDFDDDAAFAVVTNGTPTTLEQAVSGQGALAPNVGFNLSNSGTFWSFGYPAAGKFNGQTLQYCSGPVRHKWDGHDTLSMPCNMTGGSSGGPWYRSWNATLKTGTVNSLNSYGYQSVKNTMFGPVFGPDEQALFNATQTSCTSATSNSSYYCRPL